MARRKRGFFSKLIGKGYRTLSIANTIRVVASGNPGKIAKHAIRKAGVKKASRVL